MLPLLRGRRSLVALIALAALAACAPAGDGGPPQGFVRLSDVAPDIVQEIRYAGEHNFVGRPITGYEAPECWLTGEAAQALAGVQDRVSAQGYSLKVYDCFRPQRAVSDFVAWAQDPDDAVMRTEFYPRLDKSVLFPQVRGTCVAYPDEAVRSQIELRSQLGRLGIRTVAARTVDRSHRWAEPSVVAFARPDDDRASTGFASRALGIAHQMGIETVVEVDAGQWRVLTLTTEDTPRYAITASVPASVTRDTEHRCPLQSTPGLGEYCTMRGGPWTSSSIHAAAGWQAHRDQLIAALGCDTCEGFRYRIGGKVLTGGGPIPLVPVPMATRWREPDERRLAEVQT